MEVKVIKEFIDKKENKIRKVNEIFEVEDERFKEINKSVYGPFIEEVKFEHKFRKQKQN